MNNRKHIKRYSNKRRKKIPPNPALDLFGEVPVTLEDIYAWCEAVPKIPRDSWRLSWYVRCWNVPDKIRQAKMQGEFERIIEDRPLPRQHGALRWLG